MASVSLVHPEGVSRPSSIRINNFHLSGHLYEEGTVVITRPLQELWSCIKNLKLPPWQLALRSIKVLVLALFTKHFYGEMLLLRSEGLYHSMKGKVEKVTATGKEENYFPGTRLSSDMPSPFFTKQDLKKFKEQYPFLLEQALYLRPKDTNLTHYRSNESHPRYHEELTPRTFVTLPDFKNYEAITPQSVSNYFRKMCGIQVTEKIKENSITDFINSKRLYTTDYTKLFHFAKLEDEI